MGDGGLGIGDWGLGPIPNPQSPIPIEIFFFNFSNFLKNNFKKLINKNNSLITLEKNGLS